MECDEIKRIISRRNMLRRAAAASGLAAIFKATEASSSAQQAAGGRGGGGRGGAPVHYGPLNKYSSPSDLRITDMRAVTVASNFDYNIIKVDTNQGVYGLGEVRDGGSKGTALDMKPLLVGRNPLDISGILQSVRPYAGNGRQGGGYSAIDTALHDITGKVFAVPAWRLLGDKKRDRVRMYCDTTGSTDPKEYGQRMAARKKLGFTFFKMDMRWGTVGDHADAFNQFGILTDKGLGYAGELVAGVKDAIGWDQPLAVETSGNMKPGYPGAPSMLPVKDAIRFAKFYEKFDLAWLEDLFNAGSVWYWQGYKAVRDATTTKILTGEDGFGLEECFQALIDNKAVDVVHPDPGTSGQCRETKRIAEYATAHHIGVAFHMAGSPLGTLSAVHCAATLSSFLAMECHAIDFMSWWQELVTGIPKPIINQGHITVPDTVGIGIELNEPVIKEHLRVPGYFEPTPEFDNFQRGTRGPFPHFDEFGKWVNATESYDK